MVLKLLKLGVIFIALTLISQVGGIIYLLYKPISWHFNRRYSIRAKVGFKFLSFLLIYLLFNLMIIPPLARLNGRVPLPKSDQELKAWGIFTWLCNRHYVKPEMKITIEKVSQDFYAEYEIPITYLDANFPFWDGFPLLPHLSHNDGKKLDLAFVYQQGKNQFTTRVPAFLGYGMSELPKVGELNMPENCKQKGYWQYSLLNKLTGNSNLKFDQNLNRTLLLKIIDQPKIRKIFIEPHLKTRLKLDKFSKVRFHGCHAVRHDDHIHLQL